MHFEDDVVRVRKVCVGPYENNAYIVSCVKTNQAVLIDAASEPDRLIAALQGLIPHAILTTHGHFDHIGAAREVADRLAIPFRLHPDDASIAGITPDVPLAEESIAVGDMTIEALATPGHTPGSICFAVGLLVFSGDTLFPGGPGATRGPSTGFATIINSIEHRLFTMPDETLVMPGHGLDTTVGTERPHLDEWRKRGW